MLSRVPTLLVAGRIEGLHPEQLHLGAAPADSPLQGRDLRVVLALQGDHRALRAQVPGHRHRGGHHPVGEGTAEIFVGFDQRFTLGRVDQKALRLG